MRVGGKGLGVGCWGFRVQGSGFRVQGSGFRVQGSGFRVQGSGFRVQGSGKGFREGVQGRGRTCGQLLGRAGLLFGGAGRPLRVRAKFRLFLPVMDKMFVRK